MMMMGANRVQGLQVICPVKVKGARVTPQEYKAMGVKPSEVELFGLHDR